MQPYWFKISHPQAWLVHYVHIQALVSHVTMTMLYLETLSFLCVLLTILEKNCFQTFVGLFYYCLGNIHPSFRSKLQSILLLAVAETSLISKYGINIILDPFVEEMKELESVSTVVISHFILLLQVDGVPFLINGKTQYLRGALTSVVADNPASNLIGGFKNLSSAYRKCRDCLATSEEIQTMVKCAISFCNKYM